MGTMICGVDSKPGDANCNGYCQGKAQSARALTKEMQIAHLQKDAWDKLTAAQAAWYKLYGALDVGPQRSKHAEIYDNLMNATRV